MILGAGFGGLYAAKHLNHPSIRITLIDKRNYHLFQPLLYQVATAGLSPGDIAAPIRSIFSTQKNTTVILGEVTSVDTQNKKVILAHGEIDYDILIVATGATHSYFGHNEWAQHAPGLKSIEDALEIRRRALIAYETAEVETDPEARPAQLTFVIVGAGPTGVELAGALAEISQHTLARDFRNIDPTQARILLLDGQSRVLPTYPPDLSAKAQKQLEAIGVEVKTNAHVTCIDATGISLGDERIDARTVLWCAGVAADPWAASLGAPRDRAGRILVRPDLTLPDHDNVYVIGDLAAVAQGEGFVPGVAPAAIQQGRHAARNVLRTLQGKPQLDFRYVDKGSLATIGRAAAVAFWHGFHLSGIIAWFAWLVIHIFFLIGFRNRFSVIFNWAYSYLTFRKSARLIIGGNRKVDR